MNDKTKRVVVTGMGVISPVGNDLTTFWQTLLDGKGGVASITKFDTSSFATQFAAEVKGFDPEDHIDRKESRRMDIFTHYAIAAADEAVKRSGLDFDSEAKDRVGVITGSGIGGMTTFEAQSKALLERGPRRISPFFIPMMIPDIAPGYISIRFGLNGPNFATVSACASSSHAIGEAFRTIQRGGADVMITGGSEAVITPLGVGGFNAMKALSTRNDAPEKASRPFDSDRDGFVMGEGAGMLVLESLEHAQSRGADIQCEIVGVGYSADAHHITAPAPNGEGAVLSMRNALAHAEMQIDEVDYINAHGTSTPHGDVAETNAVKHVFGEHAKKMNVSSTKSMIGHLLGASGGVEFITAAMSVRHDIVHPTINLENQDPACDLNYTANKAQERVVKAALSNSFGFGGHNVSIVLKKFQE